MTVSFLIALMTLTHNNEVHNVFSIKFANLEEAKTLLTTEDSFTEAWSAFDIDSRMGKAGSSKAELMQHISEQVIEWTEDDKTKINAALDRINTKAHNSNIALQLDQVTLVKTTAKEEGGAAGYTRGHYIILAENALGENADLDKLLVHELFHVVSRTKPVLREKLYSIIGFQMMEPISYPEVLLPYRITNPDATQTDSYIMLDVGDDEKVPCMMILYAKSAYEGGSFFNYLNIGFLALDKENYTPVFNDEGPVIYGMAEAVDFFSHVGRNTQYIIHPEEIMADNFSFAILGKKELPDQKIVDKILVELQR